MQESSIEGKVQADDIPAERNGNEFAQSARLDFDHVFSASRDQGAVQATARVQKIQEEPQYPIFTQGDWHQ